MATASVCASTAGCSTAVARFSVALQPACFEQCSYLTFSSCGRAARHRQHWVGPPHERSRQRQPSLSRTVQASRRSDVAGSDDGESADSRSFEKHNPSRRNLLLLSGALGVAVAQPAVADDSAEVTSAAPPSETQTTPAPSQPTQPSETPAPIEPPQAAKQVAKLPEPNTIVTARAYLDIMVCPGTSRTDRTLGDSDNICTKDSGGEMLGRIVVGLYGKQVPRTVANFIAMVTGAAGSSYKGTLFHKIIEGQYIQAGKQGPRSEGQVVAPNALEKNPETLKSTAFALPHRRPGTLSLCLGANDDEEARKLNEDYRNVEFLITTGPGPASSLDGSNIVFGTVLEGMDVVTRIAAIPSYQPNAQIKQFNELASFLGDERAETARKFWDRPLQNVVIAGCGIIQPKPSPLPNGQP